MAVSVVASLSAISACDTSTVPRDAVLSITPAEYTVDIIESRNADDQCLIQPEFYMDIPVVFQLSTANGSPLGDVELSIYTSLAANTFSGPPVLELFEDRNGNGVVDAPLELVSDEDDQIARVKTDRWNGSRTLLLRINLSCGYRGQITAIANGISASGTISVIASEVSDDQLEE